MTEGATAGRSAKWWRALFRPWSPRMAMAAVLAVASCGVVLAFVAEAGLERGRNLSGQVTDANDGTPVVAATVEVDGEFGPNGAIIGGVAHTDDQGRFELRVRSGDRWIRVRSDGYATKTIRVPARNREAIVVALDTGGTIAGRLVLPTGEPATGDVTLVASRKDPLRPLGFWEVHRLLRGGRKATVGESGEFRLENVPPGRYRLMATSRSGTVRDRLVDVYERETNPSIRLVVKPLATIKGSLSGLIDDERATLRVERRRTARQLRRFAVSPMVRSRFPAYRTESSSWSPRVQVAASLSPRSRSATSNPRVSTSRSCGRLGFGDVCAQPLPQGHGVWKWSRHRRTKLCPGEHRGLHRTDPMRSRV